jgi:hypothetical protein
MMNLSRNFIARLDSMLQHPLSFGGGDPQRNAEVKAIIAARMQHSPQFRRDSVELQRAARRDGVDSVWFARELESLDRTIYQADLVPTVSEQVIPLDTSIPDWSTMHRWREFTMAGVPELVSSMSNQVPMVEVSGAEFLVGINMWALGWGYSMRDIETAARTGFPLDATYGLITREAMRIKMDEILMLGDATTGAVGFLKLQGVPLVTAVAKTGGGTAWSASATGMEIVQDLLKLADSVRLAYGIGNGIRVNIQMSPVNRNRLDLPMTGLGVGGATDKTIMAYIRQNHSDKIANIIESPRCAAAGVGGVSRMMATPAWASNDIAKTYVFGIAPVPFRVYPGQWHGLTYKQIAVMSCGGCGVRKPTYLAYMDAT